MFFCLHDVSLSFVCSKTSVLATFDMIEILLLKQFQTIGISNIERIPVLTQRLVLIAKLFFFCIFYCSAVFQL